MADTYKVGEAPWETGKASPSFKVGAAPWDAPKKQSTMDWLLTKDPNFAKNAPDLEGMVTAGANGAVNSALLGYMPQASGGINAAIDTVKNTSPDLDSISNALNTFKDAYGKRRDESAAYQAQLQKAHPYAYGAGSVAGAIAMPIPGLGSYQLAREAPMLAKLALAGAKGAGIGALANPGDTPGSDDTLQIKQRLMNGAMGGALGTAGEGIVQGIEKSPETLASISRWMAAKQLGANKTQLTKLIKELPDSADRGVPDATRLDQLEKYMDQNGMLNMGTTYSGVVDKSGKLMDQEGQKLSGIYNNVEDKIRVNPELAEHPGVADTALHGPDLANEFYEQEKQRLTKTHGGKSALQQIKARLGIEDGPVTPNQPPPEPSGLTALGPNASLKDVHDYRMGVDDQIPWNADDTGKLVAQSNKRLRTFLNNKMQERIGAVDGALGENNLSALKQANANYSDAATVNNIAQKTKGGEMSKTVMGLMGMTGGLGVGAYAHHNGDNWGEAALKGLGTGLAMRGARAVSPAITYRGAQALAPAMGAARNYLQKNPGVLTQMPVPWLMMNQENK